MERSYAGRSLPFLRTPHTALAAVCATLSGGVALSVLFGWAIGDRALIQVGPTFAPMQANTALAFFAGSVGLVVVASGARVIRSVGGRIVMGVTTTVVLGFGVATLIQYGFGVDLGIDELLVEGYVVTRTSHPGRMSPWTAVGFVAMGSVMLLGGRAPARSSLQYAMMALATVFVGLLASTVLVHYVFQLDPALGATRSTRMAVHTAALFLVLAAGSGSVLSLGSARARRAFAWIPVVLGAVITLTLWRGLADRDDALLRQATEAWVKEVSFQAAQVMEQRIEAVDRMAARVASGAYPTVETWMDDGDYYARQVLEGHPIAVLEPDLRVRWATDDPGAALTDALESPHAAVTAERAAEGRTARLSPLIRTSADATGLSLLVSPIVAEGLTGFVVGLVDPVAVMGLHQPEAAYDLAARFGADEVLPATVGLTEHPVASTEVTVGGRRVVLRAAKRSDSGPGSSPIPGVILAAGLAFTAMLGAVQLSAHARARSEARFRALLESAPDAGLIVDEGGRIVQANTRAATLFDVPADELEGTPVQAIAPDSVLGRPPAEWDWTERLDVNATARSGRVFPMEVSASPIQTDEGLLVSLALRDVSEWHEMVSRLRDADRLKSEFVSTVSHEMRTPLTIIREFSSIVVDGEAGPLNAEQTDHLETVIRNCDRLTGLIGDLLELARLESGKYRMDRRQTRLEPVLVACAEDFDPVATGAGLRLELRCEDGLPEVLCDADRVTQVLVNLLGNAVKFTPAGGTITVVAERVEGAVAVHVVDTGIGIAEEHQPMIFGAFVQVGREDGPGVRGTGLGLNVARQIVELHGGRLEVTSRLGEGSRFTFTLPALDGDLMREFLTPHLRRREAAPAPLTLVLLRDVEGVGDEGLEALYTTVLKVQRVGRDEALLDRRHRVLVVALEADRAGAGAFAGRLLRSLDRVLHIEAAFLETDGTGVGLHSLDDVASLSWLPLA